MTNIVIVAHHSRAEQATDLALAVDADEILFDDGTLGAAGNHRRAWDLHTNSTHTGWCVVLEDDAVPCAGFRDQLDTALHTAPTDIVSLYLGRTRPPHWQGRIEQATVRADLLGNAWIVGGQLLHAVGVAAQPRLTPTMAQWTHHLAEPVDGRPVGDEPISYTWPSLVDHADGPTVTDHPDGKARTTARTAWRHGARAEWNTHYVLLSQR
jgi:hypothetical protein